ACFTRHMSSQLAPAWLGRQLGQTPGSSNWAMQTPPCVRAYTLTDSAHDSARGTRALTYTSDLGVSHTWDGFAASGRYFDVQHGVDALTADIRARAFAVQINAE